MWRTRSVLSVALIAVLTMSAVPVAAQEPTQTQDSDSQGAISLGTPRPGFLHDAIAREAARAAQDTTSTQPTGEVPHASWAARHPVLLGAMITPGFPPMGMCVGHVVSARQKKYDAPASTRSDIWAVKRIVAKLGVGKAVGVTRTNTEQTNGTIGAIGRDEFLVVPEGQTEPMQIAYADVRGVRGKPMSPGAKVGLAACAIGAIIPVTIFHALATQ